MSLMRVYVPTPYTLKPSSICAPTHAGAEPERVVREIEEIIGLDCSNIIQASAKMGLGIEDTLEAIVTRIPPPKNNVTVRTTGGGGVWVRLWERGAT